MLDPHSALSFFGIYSPHMFKSWYRKAPLQCATSFHLIVNTFAELLDFTMFGLLQRDQEEFMTKSSRSAELTLYRYSYSLTSD